MIELRPCTWWKSSNNPGEWVGVRVFIISSHVEFLSNCYYFFANLHQLQTISLPFLVDMLELF